MNMAAARAGDEKSWLWLAIISDALAGHSDFVRVDNVFVMSPVRHFIRIIEVPALTSQIGLAVPVVRFRPLFDDPRALDSGLGAYFWSPSFGALDPDPTRLDAADRVASMLKERLIGFLRGIDDIESYLLAGAEATDFLAEEDVACVFAADGQLDIAHEIADYRLDLDRCSLPNHVKQGWETEPLERRIALLEPLVAAIPKGRAAVQAVLHANEREAARRFGIEHLYEQVPFAKLS
jgi:hypothetical protein